MKDRGFTLIELLVVIAIIAILAAILFPIFTAARARAETAKCMSNMSQVSKAIMVYSDENQGNIPFSYHAPGQMNPWDQNTWRERLRKHLRSREVLLCPVPVAEWGDFEKSQFKAGTPRNQIPHLGINRYLSTGDGVSPEGYCKLSSVQIASQTILISENRDGDWSAEPWDEDGNGVGNGGFWPYHGTNSSLLGTFIFCDGHASTMTVKRTEARIPDVPGGVQNYYWKKIKK